MPTFCRSVRFPPIADARREVRFRPIADISFHGSSCYGRVMQGACFSIQRLASGDAALAEQLNALFGEAFQDKPTHQANRPGLDYLEQLLEKDDLIVIVGLVGGEVVGGLVAYEFFKLESVRREIYIYDLAVREAHRREGIATALIAELKQIASTRGVWVIFVQADYGDDPAIQLYQKIGTREEVLNFDITV